MSQPTFCSRIFDPYYIYLQAVRQTDEHPALRAMIDDIGYEHLTMVREEDFEKVYPIKTFYHHYKRNIAVLYIMNDTFNCQTFKNGIVDIAFDIIKDNQIAKNFFEKAGDELTVIDFYNGKEIKPDYDTARAYAECVLNIEEELKQHNETISEYMDRLKSIKQECEVLYSTNPSVSYKNSINLLINCMETASELFQKKYRNDIKSIEAFLAYKPSYESYIKMFGLYVYVINYGISHKRFLKRDTRRLSIIFNRTLSKFREFIAQNEGIVDKYIDYMDMNRNERENLMYLLTQEELITNASRFIGDDLFC